MKLKNIFSNRSKNKRKKNSQQASSVNEVSSSDNAATDNKRIIPPDTKDGRVPVKENELSVAANANSVEYYSKENVVLRSKVKRSVDADADADETELTKPRVSSTSSSNSSTKARSSRRPWSFIDQLRRQDSRESTYSTDSSVRTSHLAEEFISSRTPPPRDDALPQLRGETHSHGNRNSCTLPRSLTPEHFEQASKSKPRQDSAKRRTMDFRFFNFFKRSSSGESSAPSDALSSASGSLANSGRTSFRRKNKANKKASKKRNEDSNIRKDSLENSRMRSFSDGGETSTTLTFDHEFQVPPPGLYDSAPWLNAVNEYPESALETVVDRRVPVNGEPAYYLCEEDMARHPADRIPPGSRKYMRRSDPTSSSSTSHSVLRMQLSEGRAVVRSSSDSADFSSRRSSFVCEPRDTPLPEHSIASFDSSAYLGCRARKLYAAGSVPQIPQRCNNQKVERALSNEISKDAQAIGAQARCSQSVSNLASGSVDQNSSPIPRSSSDVDKPRFHRRTPQPSPHQQKQEENNYSRGSATSVNCAEFIAPPSPVLRAIGYPGVVLRRNKQKPNKLRPNSAHADQRTQHVMSLNMEDLPTYSQMRREMTKSGAKASLEDILSLQEYGPHSTKRCSNGGRYANTTSGRAKRRGATLSHYGQRTSTGFSTAASVEDGLDYLSSRNFGSKQSLLDEDEMLNAILARSLAVTHTSSGNLRSQEPSSKRAKAIRKSVVSLANLISPGKPNQKGGKLQRSSSFKESESLAPPTTAAAYSFKPYRPPSNTPNKTKNNRRSKLWGETFDHTGLNEGERKWQEAIFELYQGERDLVKDLTMAKQTYRDSMVTLKMLSDEEVTLIFGKLGCLLPLHEELLSKLEQARGEDGRTLAIGYIFIEWFPRISTAYREYCANQSDAKYALDAAVERDARVRDFLQRCLESPFSRKLDLWSYLDLPRTRLVKYPLLLQNVLKRTLPDLKEEKDDLIRVMEIVGEIIEKVDETTGEQQCRYIVSKLEYLDEKQKSPFIDNSRLMLCSGQLKNNRGTKMHVFLFEEALVLTRQTTRSNKISYQVYRHPMPLRTLVIDTNEGEKLSGSFRGGILSSEKVKNSFRVRSEELNVTYTLQASEEHDRKQWINAIQDALCKYKAKHPEALENQNQISRKKATHDHHHSKKLNPRSVLRSSSDKSTNSVTSSSDKSSLQEESQEDDTSTTSEDIVSWPRTRSHNLSIQSSQSAHSVSRNSSGSSTKSDISTDSKGSKKTNADVKKLKDRLKHLESEADGPPSPLRDAPRKLSSISRHFSLTGADRAKIVSRIKNDETEKARNKCQRSRSLTSSPQTVKSIVARFGAKRLSNCKIVVTSGLVAPTAAKPPIAPPASPFSVRRTPSLRTQCTIHEAQSTPNLTVARSTSFFTRRSSAGISYLAARDSSDGGVGSLRKGRSGGSTSDLRSESLERRAEAARFSRKARKENKPASEGDAQGVAFVKAMDKCGPCTVSDKVLVSKQPSVPKSDDCKDEGTAASENSTENSGNGTQGNIDEIKNENLTPATHVTLGDVVVNSGDVMMNNGDVMMNNGDVMVNSAQAQDNEISEIETVEEPAAVTVVSSGDVMVTDVLICFDSDTGAPPSDSTNQSPNDVMAEFSDHSTDEELPRPQNSCGDLISFANMETDEPVKEDAEAAEKNENQSSIPETQDSLVLETQDSLILETQQDSAPMVDEAKEDAESVEKNESSIPETQDSLILGRQQDSSHMVDEAKEDVEFAEENHSSIAEMQDSSSTVDEVMEDAESAEKNENHSSIAETQDSLSTVDETKEDAESAEENQSSIAETQDSSSTVDEAKKDAESAEENKNESFIPETQDSLTMVDEEKDDEKSAEENKNQSSVLEMQDSSSTVDEAKEDSEFVEKNESSIPETQDSSSTVEETKEDVESAEENKSSIPETQDYSSAVDEAKEDVESAEKNQSTIPETQDTSSTVNQAKEDVKSSEENENGSSIPETQDSSSTVDEAKEDAEIAEENESFIPGTKDSSSTFDEAKEDAESAVEANHTATSLSGSPASTPDEVDEISMDVATIPQEDAEFAEKNENGSSIPETQDSSIPETQDSSSTVVEPKDDAESAVEANPTATSLSGSSASTPAEVDEISMEVATMPQEDAESVEKNENESSIPETKDSSSILDEAKEDAESAVEANPTDSSLSGSPASTPDDVDDISMDVVTTPQEDAESVEDDENGSSITETQDSSSKVDEANPTDSSLSGSPASNPDEVDEISMDVVTAPQEDAESFKKNENKSSIPETQDSSSTLDEATPTDSSLYGSPASTPDEVDEISMDVVTTPQEDVVTKVLADVQGELTVESNTRIVGENPPCLEEENEDVMRCGEEEDSSENSRYAEVESFGTDNDEGIVQDACTSSDIDNNNVQPSRKTSPDSETDEQISLETDSEPSNCCRSDIRTKTVNGDLICERAFDRT